MGFLDNVLSFSWAASAITPCHSSQSSDQVWACLAVETGFVLQSLQGGTDASVHSITQGMEDWDLIDESYVMVEPDEGNDILLAVDHPQSMKAIAWTRTFKQARVFCLQSGHDNQTYGNPQFRHIVARGIQWCAGRI